MYDEILRALIDAVPGARGAVFCDSMGESVNSVGASGRSDPARLNDFDLRVAGAQLATPIDLALRRSAGNLGKIAEFQISGPHETLLVQVLPEGFYVVLCLEPGALVARGRFELGRTAERLAREI